MHEFLRIKNTSLEVGQHALVAGESRILVSAQTRVSAELKLVLCVSVLHIVAFHMKDARHRNSGHTMAINIEIPKIKRIHRSPAGLPGIIEVVASHAAKRRRREPGTVTPKSKGMG